MAYSDTVYPAKTVKIHVSADQKKELVDAFFACSAMKNAEQLEILVFNLPDEIKYRIERYEDARQDVESIISACLEDPDGMRTLFAMLHYLEGDTKAMRAVEKLWLEIKSPFSMLVKTTLLVGLLWGFLVFFGVFTKSFYPRPVDIILYLMPTMLAVGGAIVMVANSGRKSRQPEDQVKGTYEENEQVENADEIDEEEQDISQEEAESPEIV